MINRNNFEKLSFVETILWDWNGTLLDDVEICILAMNKLLTERKMQPITTDFYYNHFTFPVKRYYEQMGWDFTKESFDEISIHFMANYDALFNSSPLQLHTLETLAFFKARGYNQMVLSALENNRLTESLNLHGLDHFFDASYGIENILGGGKIHLAKQLITEQRLNPARTLMIGDTEHDFEVAQSMGAQCILVAHGHHKPERLQRLEVPVVNNFTELTNLFAEVKSAKA